MEQENLYVKQFPDLMAGKKIMYVHGFGSAASTHTVVAMQTLMPNAKVFAEDMPLNPQEAMALLHRLCEQEQPDLIIGTSMGGMYTEQLHGFDRILVNPALEMGKTMSAHGMTGKQTYQNPRKDGVQEFIVTKAMVKEYDECTTHCFEDTSDVEKTHVWGLFGDKDPLVHTFNLFRSHYPQAVHCHGEHRLTEKMIHHYLIPIIRRIDDRQQKRERQSVYITYQAMHDSYGKPLSSLHKAYEMLIEKYDVYVVAPQPTNTPEDMTEVVRWVEEYLSAPAFDRIVFTNKPSLLYGDFFIDAASSPWAAQHNDLMATAIALGSDQFKTWEEVITYFSRLG